MKKETVMESNHNVVCSYLQIANNPQIPNRTKRDLWNAIRNVKSIAYLGLKNHPIQ